MVKKGRDAKLEADANKWLAESVGANKPSVARDVEKIKYEHGWIGVDELQHYDPANTWDTQDSAFQIVTSADDLDYVDGTWDADNIIKRNDDQVKRRQLSQPVDDGNKPLFEGDEADIFLGAYDVRKKVCTLCGRSKRRDQYSPDARNKDGLRPKCKSCERESSKQRYARKNT